MSFTSSFDNDPDEYEQKQDYPLGKAIYFTPNQYRISFVLIFELKRDHLKILVAQMKC